MQMEEQMGHREDSGPQVLPGGLCPEPGLSVDVSGDRAPPTQSFLSILSGS